MFSQYEWPKGFYPAVCVPFGNHQAFSRFCISLRQLILPEQYKLCTTVRLFASIARNELVKEAIALGCSHIVFIDDDMLFEPNTLIRLLEHRKNTDIIGALYYRRKGLHAACYFVNDGDYLALPMGEINNKGLVEIEGIGFGFTIIPVEVFKYIDFPWFVSDDRERLLKFYPKASYTYITEEVTFCLRAKLAKYKIYVDTNTILKHLDEPEQIDEWSYLKQGRAFPNKLPEERR